MEKLAKELMVHLKVPSPLWAVHVHPKNEFVSVFHVKVTSDKILVDKGIVLTPEKTNICLKMFLNGFVYVTHDVGYDTTADDISVLVATLHSKNVCLNSADRDNYPQCLKIVEINNSEDANDESAQYCKSCWNIQDPFGDVDWNTTSKSAPKDNKKNVDEMGLCNICGRMLANRYHLNSHILTHNNTKNFKCTTCNRSFTKMDGLRVHQRTHSAHTDERRYVCNICGKAYRAPNGLRDHKWNHHRSGEKPQRCKFCNATFVYPCNLKVHMRKHTGEKPYVCTVCEQYFSTAAGLHYHQRSTHKLKE